MSIDIYRRADGSGELQLDGVLETEESWWMSDGTVVAREFRRALKACKDVTVYINSPGGDVMAGAEIYTALREHSQSGRGHVTVKISGIAASAASVVAMAGDTILMSPVAYMMIHNPWSIAQGDARTMRQTADVLDTVAEGLIAAYQLRTGKSRDEITAMLDAETYMSAQECVDEGFADGILYQDGTIGSDDTHKATKARMTSKAYGAQAVCALIRDHRPAPEEPEAPDDTAWREEIAARAAAVQAASAALAALA